MMYCVFDAVALLRSFCKSAMLAAFRTTGLVGLMRSSSVSSISRALPRRCALCRRRWVREEVKPRTLRNHKERSMASLSGEGNLRASASLLPAETFALPRLCAVRNRIVCAERAEVWFTASQTIGEIGVYGTILRLSTFFPKMTVG